MNREEQKRVIEIDMYEFENGYMDSGTPSARLNHSIRCFPADMWLNTMFHRYNTIRTKREKYQDSEDPSRIMIEYRDVSEEMGDLIKYNRRDYGKSGN